MSDDEFEEGPEPLLARLTARERVAIPAGVLTGFAVGWWAGLLSVPDEALDVPTETGAYGEVSAVYVPVPTYMVVLTVVILVAAAWCAWRASQRPGGRWTVEEPGGDGQ